MIELNCILVKHRKFTRRPKISMVDSNKKKNSKREVKIIDYGILYFDHNL